MSIAILPNETDTPLVIDTDTVLTFSIAGQLLQMVGGWIAQVMQDFCRVKDFQFAAGGTLNIGWKFARELAIENLLSLLVGETLYHRSYSNAMRYQCQV
jgi:hypothetical protein